MKFIKHNIDFSIMSQEELSYAKGYNAGIAHCEKVLAERKQLKKERKELKEKGLLKNREWYTLSELKTKILGDENDVHGPPNEIGRLPTRFSLIEDKLNELEKYIMDVDETAGERFKEIFDILAVHSKKLYDIENPSGLKKEPDGVHRY